MSFRVDNFGEKPGVGVNSTSEANCSIDKVEVQKDIVSGGVNPAPTDGLEAPVYTSKQETELVNYRMAKNEVVKKAAAFSIARTEVHEIDKIVKNLPDSLNDTEYNVYNMFMSKLDGVELEGVDKKLTSREYQIYKDCEKRLNQFSEDAVAKSKNLREVVIYMIKDSEGYYSHKYSEAAKDVSSNMFTQLLDAPMLNEYNEMKNKKSADKRSRALQYSNGSNAKEGWAAMSRAMTGFDPSKHRN